MKVGTLCFATDQGLGVLAKSFYDHGVLTDVLMIRHGKRAEHPEWYPHSDTVYNLGSPQEREKITDFVSRMDAMLFFETPFVWEILQYCRERGVRTYLMPMYECMPRALPEQPDTFICPSELDLQYYPNTRERRSVYLPVPVDVPWRQRTKAEVFVHNAGHGGLMGRNGTAELVEAWGMVESPAVLILRSQDPLSPIRHRYVSRHGVEGYQQNGTLPFDQLYTEGDVFLFPEKFNGLSLPLQEARASGMLVIGTNRFPINRWLPNGPLIVPSGCRTSSISARLNCFNESILSPKDIAAKVDEYYGTDITEYSLSGKRWAEENSWDALKPKYLEVLSR